MPSTEPRRVQKGGLIEGIFGAEETKRHQLHCRFIREDNRLRFAKIRAIAWNIKVLNRFECASNLRIPIPSYGGLARATCAQTGLSTGKRCVLGS